MKGLHADLTASLREMPDHKAPDQSRALAYRQRPQDREAENAASVNILMYHSISSGDGPTCISPDTFAMQMAELEESGNTVVSLTDIARWHRGHLVLPENAVAVTFDDGFLDFATHAFAQLYPRRWPSTVFLPTAKVGQREDWDQECTHKRLLDWTMIEELAKAGVEFGGHSATHADLTRLSDTDLKREIRQSQQDIAQRLGCAPRAFAQPFGHSNRRVRNAIQEHYDLSVGTRFDKARTKHDLFELPRIEMHYFRDRHHWRSFLDGANGYLKRRQSLRGLRRLVNLALSQSPHPGPFRHGRRRR